MVILVIAIGAHSGLPLSLRPLLSELDRLCDVVGQVLTAGLRQKHRQGGCHQTCRSEYTQRQDRAALALRKKNCGSAPDNLMVDVLNIWQHKTS